jgi:hypothetical protein
MCDDNGAVSAAVLNSSDPFIVTSPIAQPAAPLSFAAAMQATPPVPTPPLPTVSNSISGLKASFRDANGLLLVLDALASLPLDQKDTASALFLLISEAITGCDPNKVRKTLTFYSTCPFDSI